MKTREDVLWELQRLYSIYENEVVNATEQGLLTVTTARTYLVHAYNFIKWCEDDFEPGGRNKKW